MRLKTLLLLGTTIAALSTGLLTRAASAANGLPCNATTVFAPWGDTAGYVQMNDVGASKSGASVFKASCVNFLEPEIRIVAQNVGDPSATLSVSVQYRDETGSHDETIGTLSGFSDSQPSAVLSFDPSQLRGNVQVTLTPSGPSSDWLVSGVYIDPFCAR